MSAPAIERAVNLPKGQIAQALKLLELDGAVARDGGRYLRTPNPWQQDEERIERVMAARRLELAQMQAYMRHDGCYMEFLARLLDDPTAAPCGRCSNDVGRGLPREVDPERVRAAVSFLRRDLRTIKPRMLWAPDAVPGLSGKITPPNEVGCALSVYGDAGWGRDVQRGKYVDGQFGRDLVIGAARAIRDRWQPRPEPAWVTAVPTSVRPGMNEAFARSLAAELGLPYVQCLTVVAGAPPQSEMQNSAQQLRNVRDKLRSGDEAVPSGPVLLVDDIVDSGWTMTVAGDLLRSRGSGPVHPFALAMASGRDA